MKKISKRLGMSLPAHAGNKTTGKSTIDRLYFDVAN